MHYLVSKVSTKYKNTMFLHYMKSFKPFKGRNIFLSHLFQNISWNLNTDGRNKCHGMASHKISLFSKMQRGRSPSFELLQLDMNVSIMKITPTWKVLPKLTWAISSEVCMIEHFFGVPGPYDKTFLMVHMYCDLTLLKLKFWKCYQCNIFPWIGGRAFT